jgi:hypothetical protein
MNSYANGWKLIKRKVSMAEENQIIMEEIDRMVIKGPQIDGSRGLSR